MTEEQEQRIENDEDRIQCEGCDRTARYIVRSRFVIHEMDEEGNEGDLVAEAYQAQADDTEDYEDLCVNCVYQRYGVDLREKVPKPAEKIPEESTSKIIGKCDICGIECLQERDVIVRDWARSRPEAEFAIVCGRCADAIIRSVSLFNGRMLVESLKATDVQDFFSRDGKIPSEEEALSWIDRNEEQLRNYNLNICEALDDGDDVFVWDSMPDFVRRHYDPNYDQTEAETE
jgi:hypothetical protein